MRAVSKVGGVVCVHGCNSAGVWESAMVPPCKRATTSHLFNSVAHLMRARACVCVCKCACVFVCVLVFPMGVPHPQFTSTRRARTHTYACLFPTVAPIRAHSLETNPTPRLHTAIALGQEPLPPAPLIGVFACIIDRLKLFGTLRRFKPAPAQAHKHARITGPHLRYLRLAHSLTREYSSFVPFFHSDRARARAAASRASRCRLLPGAVGVQRRGFPHLALHPQGILSKIPL